MGRDALSELGQDTEIASKRPIWTRPLVVWVASLLASPDSSCHAGHARHRCTVFTTVRTLPAEFADGHQVEHPVSVGEKELPRSW